MTTDHRPEPEPPAPYRTMGVDPGTIVAGYAVLEDDQTPRAVDHGAIKNRATDPLPKRLKNLRDQVSELIRRHRPDIVAIENPFVGRNAKTSMAIGQAQAAVLIAAADHGLAVATYPPSQVKQHVADSGRASKEQVRILVSAQLSINRPATTDEADALAVALCHLNHRRAEHTLQDEWHPESIGGKANDDGKRTKHLAADAGRPEGSPSAAARRPGKRQNRPGHPGGPKRDASG